MLILYVNMLSEEVQKLRAEFLLTHLYDTSSGKIYWYSDTSNYWHEFEGIMESSSERISKLETAEYITKLVWRI